MSYLKSSKSLFSQKGTVARPPKVPRGIVILDSYSTGLLGGEELGMVINGKFSTFDWDKAMLLTKSRKHYNPRISAIKS